MNLKKEFEKLTLVYYAILASTVFFVAALYFLMNMNETANTTENNYIAIETFGIVFILIAIPASYIIYSSKSKKSLAMSLEKKFEVYKKLKLSQYIILDTAGVVSGVIFSVNQNKSFLYLIIMIFIIFIINRPSINRFAQDFEIEEDIDKQ